MADMTSVYQITGVDGLSGPAGTAEAALGRLESAGSRVGSVLGTAVQAGAVAAAAGLAAIGAGIAASISSAASFEQSISHIGAVAGASGTQMQALSSTALELGKATAFSATEAASGMEELIKAGVSITDVIGGGARAALDLAAAGGVSVAEAATIASNAMNVFSVDGANAGHVADVIAGAANASAIDVHDFGFSLSAVGAVAATVGLSLEDTATSIAVLGQAGLKGSDAGTSLKTMLLNLSPTSKAATAEMRALGIITEDGSNRFFDATGKVKSMAEVAGILQESMKGLTKEQQLNALQTAFGTDAVRAAAIMAKAGATGFNEMAEAESKVTAQAVGMARLDNLAGDIEQLKGSLETAAITIGTAFLPALRGLAQGATQYVNQAIDVIQLLPAAWQDVVDIFTSQSTAGNFEGLLERLGLSEATVVMIDDWLGQIGDAWRTVGQVFANDWSPSAEINPFVNAVGIAATVVRDQLIPTVQAAFGWVLDNWEAVKGGLIGVGVALAGLAAVAGIAALAAGIAALVTPIGLLIAGAALLGAAWVNNWGDIQGAVGAFVEWFQTNLPLIEQTATTVAGAIQSIWAAVGPTMTSQLQTSLLEMRAKAATELQNLGDVVKAAMQAINGDWSDAWATMTALAAREEANQLAQNTAHGELMTAAIDNWTGGALTSFNNWVGATATAFAVWTTDTATAIATWVTDTATGIATWVTDTATAITTWVTDTETMFTTWGTDLLAAITGAWDAVTTTITTAWTTIGTAFALGIAAVQLVWQAGWDAVGAIVTAAWNLITPENQAKITELLGLFGELWATGQALWAAGTQAIATMVTGWWATLTTTYQTASAAITAQVTTWWTEAQALWTASVAAITAIVTPWWTALAALWTTSETAITTETTTWWTAVSALWDTTTAAITTTVTGWWGALSTLWTTSLAALTSAITTALAPWVALFETTMAAIGTAITGAATTLAADATALGKSIIDAIVGSINASIGAIANALIAGVRGAIGAATSAIPGMGGGGGGGGNAGGGSAAMLSNRSGGTHASQYLSLINQVSQESGVPADVIAAILDTEGSGAGSTSPAGARGLMQVMPNYVAPGENPFDPLTSIRQGARALNEKYRATGTWEGAAGAYFGYGVDAGGMSTSVYQQRFNANRAQYQNMPTGASTDPAMQMNRVPLGPNPLAAGTTGIGGWTPNDMQAVIDLAPPWERAMEQVQTSGETAFTGVLKSSTDMGDGVTLTTTQTGATVTATMTDAAGTILGSWTSLATDVPAAATEMGTGVTGATDTMSAQALVSVTALGTGVLTSITDTAGNTTATVTDMAGHVTQQFTTMANGAQLEANTMGQGTVTSVNDMGDAVITTVQDMSGNVVTTTTDMHGNVLSQITQMADGTTTQTVAMQAGVTTATAAMGTDVQATVDTMATGVTTSMTDMGNGVTETVVTTAAGTVATLTDWSGQVIGVYTETESQTSAAVDTMGGSAEEMAGRVDEAGQQVGSTLGDMGQAFKGTGAAAKNAVRPIEELATAAASVRPINMGDTVKNLQAVEKQALSAAKALTQLGEAGKNVSGSGGSGGGEGTGGGRQGGGKAEGGPVAAGTAYLVGERGVPELFIPNQSGYIVPNAGLGRSIALPDQQTTSDADSARIIALLQQIAARVSSGDKHFELTVNTNASHEPIIQDFAILESLARSAT